MYKSSVSVRAYNFMVHKMGYAFPFSQSECVNGAVNILLGKVNGAGLKTAIELLRAGGLGIWQIWIYVNGRKTFHEIKMLCEKFDTELHEAL